jgi:tetratricopeptide (TPR) repeat protein
MTKTARLAVLAALVVLAAILIWLGLAALHAKSVALKAGNSTPAPAAQTPGAPAGTGQAPASGSGSDEAAPPEQPELGQLYEQGYQYYNGRQYDKAIDLFDQVIARDPGHYQAYTVKGIALCYSGRFDEGMGNIDKALELKPDYGSARFNKALAYELYAQYEPALYWYEQTIAVEPASVWSFYGKASIYGRRGDVANTVKYLKQAIDLNPEVKREARGEKDFDNVRNSPEFQSLVSE